MNLTERLIQNLIWKDLSAKHSGFVGIVAPNSTLFGWESDLLHVNRKNLVIEYEIKISRSDFRADLKKIRHRILHLIKEYERGPSYFFYVTQRDLIEPKDVPDYAGLIYAHPVYQVVKAAPQLHNFPISDKSCKRLQLNMIARYWRERMKLDGCERSKPSRIAHVRSSQTSTVADSGGNHSS